MNILWPSPPACLTCHLSDSVRWQELPHRPMYRLQPVYQERVAVIREALA